MRAQHGVPGPIERFQGIVCADAVPETLFVLVPHLQGEERSSPSPRLGLVFGTNPCVDEVGTKIVQLSGMGSPILLFSGISLSQRTNEVFIHADDIIYRDKSQRVQSVD